MNTEKHTKDPNYVLKDIGRSCRVERRTKGIMISKTGAKKVVWLTAYGSFFRSGMLVEWYEVV